MPPSFAKHRVSLFSPAMSKSFGSTAEHFQDSLENEQPAKEVQGREQSEGKEGSPSELAAPNPVHRHASRRDSLESRQSGLSELAAPNPVDRNASRRYSLESRHSGLSE